LERHQAYLPVHTNDANAVVPGCTDRAGDVRTMHVDCCAVWICAWSVINSAVVVKEVEPIHIINKPVTVVIKAIAGNFSRILPDVVSQVRMIDIDPLIDDGDDDAATAGRDVP